MRNFELPSPIPSARESITGGNAPDAQTPTPPTLRPPNFPLTAEAGFLGGLFGGDKKPPSELIPKPQTQEERQLEGLARNGPLASRIREGRRDVGGWLDSLVPTLSSDPNQRFEQVANNLFPDRPVWSPVENNFRGALLISDAIREWVNLAGWGPRQFYGILDQLGLNGQTREQIIRQYYRSEEHANGENRGGYNDEIEEPEVEEFRQARFRTLQADRDYQRWAREHPRNRIPDLQPGDEQESAALFIEHYARVTNLDDREQIESWLDEISHRPSATPEEHLIDIMEVLRGQDSIDREHARDYPENYLNGAVETLTSRFKETDFSPNQVNGYLRELNLGADLEGRFRGELYRSWEEEISRCRDNMRYRSSLDHANQARINIIEADAGFQNWKKEQEHFRESLGELAPAYETVARMERGRLWPEGGASYPKAAPEYTRAIVEVGMSVDAMADKIIENPACARVVAADILKQLTVQRQWPNLPVYVKADRRLAQAARNFGIDGVSEELRAKVDAVLAKPDPERPDLLISRSILRSYGQARSVLGAMEVIADAQAGRLRPDINTGDAGVYLQALLTLVKRTDDVFEAITNQSIRSHAETASKAVASTVFSQLRQALIEADKTNDYTDAERIARAARSFGMDGVSDSLKATVDFVLEQK